MLPQTSKRRTPRVRRVVSNADGQVQGGTMTERGVRHRREPLRRCVICRVSSSKRQLIRLVRTKDGWVVIDPTGKLAGRGAYLCRSEACWDDGRLAARLGQALRTHLSAEDGQRLRADAGHLLADMRAAENRQANQEPVGQGVHD